MDGSSCGANCNTSVCGTFTSWAGWTACSVTCGGGTRTRTRCFEWNDQTADQCETQTDDCNEQSCPKVCTCQSTNWNNLSAKLCNLDGTNCEDNCNASVCGGTKTTVDSCPVTCGGGQQLVSTVFVWAKTGKEEIVSVAQQNCNEQDCPKEL